eukprot:6171880-Pleurochrysis_carterae.AAC.2
MLCAAGDASPHKLCVHSNHWPATLKSHLQLCSLVRMSVRTDGKRRASLYAECFGRSDLLPRREAPALRDYA